MTVFYPWLLALHSWTRWAVFLTAALVAARAVQGRAAGRTWATTDAAATRAWVGAIDLQAFLGMMLYFAASPVALVARLDPAAAFRDSTLRFFGALHPLAMALAFAASHATLTAVRRVGTSRARFDRLGLGALATLGLLAIATPWPVLAYGRPLLRAL